jgi:hypothetical protein
MGMILREQESQRRRSLLSVVINPAIMPIVGARGIAALLREEVKNLGINPDDVVKSKEALDDLEMLQQIQQVAGVEQKMAEQGGAGDGSAGSFGSAGNTVPSQYSQSSQSSQSPAYRRAATIQADPVAAGMGGVRERGGVA